MLNKVANLEAATAAGKRRLGEHILGKKPQELTEGDIRHALRRSGVVGADSYSLAPRQKPGSGARVTGTTITFYGGAQTTKMTAAAQ